MCFHDGPGIRTTVFMKGCSLHCPWCSNPENIKFTMEQYYIKEKCDEYREYCLDRETCQKEVLDGKLSKEVCPFRARGCYGKYYAADELLEELLRDKAYYDTGGGVTFSGGEALMHMDYLEDIMEELKKRKIHIAVETSLHVPIAFVRKAIPYVDLLYIDVKILDHNDCQNILGGDVEQFKSNVDYVISQGIEVIFRVPCSNQYTLKEKNRKLLLDFFGAYKEISIEIFKLHRLGEMKYTSLGLFYDIDDRCDDMRMYEFQKDLERQGNHVRVMTI